MIEFLKVVGAILLMIMLVGLLGTWFVLESQRDQPCLRPLPMPLTVSECVLR